MSESDTPVAKLPRPKRKHPQHARLVAAFVAKVHNADVAAETGLSLSTIHRWKRDPENWAEVEAARGEVLREALAKLRNGMPKAAERLVRVAEKSDRDDWATRAALGVFEAFRGINELLAVDARLSALEQQMQQRSVTPPAGGRQFATILGGR